MFSLCFTASVYGESLTDVNNQINEKKTELQKGQEEESEVKGEIDEMNQKINQVQDEIDEIQSNINNTQVQIDAAQKNLITLQKKMKKQKQDLNKRLRTIYMNDNTTFIEVIINSDSISDFMVNLELLKRIHKADKDLVVSLEDQHEKIENEKRDLNSLKASLEASQQSVQEKKASLDADKAVLNEKAASISASNQETKEEIGALEEEANRLTQEIQAMNAAKSSSGESADTSYTYTGGMSWPCSGSVSCEYGYRNCPYHGYELHTGMDIAVRTGTPIYAAASGTVVQAYYNSSYGNMVLIDNGGGIHTLYAHNSRLAVSSGQKVSKGQVIAYAGSTGNSTGPHCHFEVRKNGQPVNPRKYLG